MASATQFVKALDLRSFSPGLLYREGILIRSKNGRIYNIMIYTIGHSTHPIDEFIHILQAYEIESVIDVRSIPKSRHNPQFNEGELKDALGKANIDYIRLEALGGRRRTSKTSVNAA